MRTRQARTTRQCKAEVEAQEVDSDEVHTDEDKFKWGRAESLEKL